MLNGGSLHTKSIGYRAVNCTNKRCINTGGHGHAVYTGHCTLPEVISLIQYSGGVHGTLYVACGAKPDTDSIIVVFNTQLLSWH